MKKDQLVAPLAEFREERRPAGITASDIGQTILMRAFRETVGSAMFGPMRMEMLNRYTAAGGPVSIFLPSSADSLASISAVTAAAFHRQNRLSIG